MEVDWVGMWKDLYCFALRIDMVLPDWRGFIGLVLRTYVFSGPIDLKLASQPHILKGTCTKPQSHHAEYRSLHVCVSVNLEILSITFEWLLCARRESPLDGQMRFSRSSPHWYMVAADAACIPM